MAMHQLISIPASHYCERARWALEYAAIPYNEDKWPPMLHLLGTLPTSRTRTVPVLKCPRTPTAPSRVLTDSADIVRYAHEWMVAEAQSATTSGGSGARCQQDASPAPSPLYPSDPDELNEVLRLEQLFSGRLGVWTRVVAYHYLFAGPPDMALRVLAPGPQAQPPGLAAWRGAVLRAALPVMRAGIRRGFRVDEENAKACLERVRQVFDEVSTRLETGGRGYLVGSSFTAADLTFAAMASVLLLPSGYGAYLPPLESWSQDFPAAQLRNTPAGRHVMRMYELHRQPGDCGAATVGAAGGAARGVDVAGAVAECRVVGVREDGDSRL